ncbi:hypothetical protein SDRG_12333 [Saprolegnia diclina VS20]|uniref:Malonyl-CoA:ACP transacylase (MAT) domain-containing protein n=1 Tax=Saprolegnia diclina (strain VS20) TaxID=1156394 RepID=T0RCW4_SAPDV|nr:hypothetical protein SDRG_12333 [Saprolegnia diclina VS20]EQC30058.1 hypothetical protein SDRG_12333 [Saprolegnia diclina VS20]|eukprot:XP_008616625.1 hypothetical protein SDRG_12333 [Saprolegnia diclina VS20]
MPDHLHYLFPLASDDLHAAVTALVPTLEKGNASLAELYRTWSFSDRGASRLVVRASTLPELLNGLHSFLNGCPKPDVVFVAMSVPATPPPLVYIFSGMGGQWNGMGATLYEVCPVFASALTTAEDALLAVSGGSRFVPAMLDLSSTSMTTNAGAQAGNFVLQVALLAELSSRLIAPYMGALGLSAGEPAAAYAAGSLSLGDAAKVAWTRLVMQNRVAEHNGGMLAVRASAATIAPLLPAEVEVAAVLSPHLSTVTGPTQALDALRTTLPSSIVTINIPMRAAYHSSIMEQANIPVDLVMALQDLSPQISARARHFSTVTGDEMFTPVNAAYWYASVRQPVLFQSAVESALRAGGAVFVELGPHSSVARAIDCIAGASASSVPSMLRGTNELLQLDRATIHLYLHGHAIQWRYAEACVPSVTTEQAVAPLGDGTHRVVPLAA